MNNLFSKFKKIFNNNIIIRFRTNKIIIFIEISIIILLPLLLFYFISSTIKEKTEIRKEDNKVIIGFAMGTLKEERWFKDRDFLAAKAKEKGYEIEWVNANENDFEQVNQVKYLLTKNIDILVIVPNSYDKCKAAVELAKKKGISVISYDRLIRDADIDAYISFNNYSVGEQMAKALLSQKPNGNYVFLLGNAKDYNVYMIKQGYEKILKNYFNNNSIRKLYENYSPNWKKEYAYEYVNNLLDQGKHIDAILAANDSLAEGAIMALSEKRLAGIVPVVGQDADISACQRIVKGTQLMTVYKPIDKLAELTIDIIDKLLKNKPLKTSIYLNNGYKKVPTFFIEPISVYSYNIDDTVIKDNFHTFEEVYMIDKENKSN
ncbi:sugar ABC transporter substrate-binding protein [Caldicellulosiruptoraceae bacterium PP1]